MLVSRFFKLGRNQATLDFLEVHIDKDIPVFVDPAALRSIQTDWGLHCVSLLQNYFSAVLAAIQRDDDYRAKQRQRLQSDYAETLLYKQFKALIS